MAMRPLDCRFSSSLPPPKPITQRFHLLECLKTYSASRIVAQDPVISHAAWLVKWLAREQLREPEAMLFIGQCISRSPQKYGILLASPDINALKAVIEEAERLRPDGFGAIVSQVGVAIELLKIRSRLTFEGPHSAFAYLDSSPKAKQASESLGKELDSVRAGLKQHGHFIFHPKTVELHSVLKQEILGKCLVLCTSPQQATELGALFHRSANVYFSSDPSDAGLRDYATLVIFSPTTRLNEAIKIFRGSEVVMLATSGTWEERVCRHYVELEKSLQAKQGKLELGVPPDCER